ncbi:hypothetical protein CH371_12490 [Leptospira wolffii]|uniref:Uncharacterized protein n=1 Tax=Leptospira wolffii TaxID=409998 RepID=A0A2M9ZBI9_9LEPT|nr:hypothetical protein [Leptospira wolffii]PJZ65732.1 hypothetical protein CH371_12490 [Leptospira wolffii]
MFLPNRKFPGVDPTLPNLHFILRLTALFFTLSLSFLEVNAEESLTSSLDSSWTRLEGEEFDEGWRKYSKEKDARPLKSWFRSHPKLSVGDCTFHKNQDSEEVQYLHLSCPDRKLEGFFYSGKEKIRFAEKIRSFHVKGPTKIGKAVYWEISFSREEARNAGLHPENRISKQSKIETKTSTENFGLQYFLSIARHPAHRPAPVGKEIFFDSSCPLLYLGKDADFYWDKALYFSFQASCLPDSPYSWIRIKADAGGNVLVDDKPAESLQEGERFLAKLKLQAIEKDKIVWSDAELFHE